MTAGRAAGRAGDRAGRRGPTPVRLLVLGACLAALAIIAGWLVASARDVGDALAGLDWRLLPVIAALVAADYAIRFLRWRWLFRRATGVTLPLRRDVALFLAGTAMILTPGRAGEWVRSLYARRLLGVPVSQTALIPPFERVVDAAAMLFLAGCGAVVFGGPLVVAGVAGGVACGGLVVWRTPRLVGAAWQVVRTKAPRVEPLFTSSALLCRPYPVALSFAMGLGAWTLECVAFFLVLGGLGVGTSAALFAKATFVYPVATLAGTFSLLPGGLGVTEGGIAGMLRALLGLGVGPSAAAALLIRVAIIGPGVVAGLPPLLMLGRESLRDEAPARGGEYASSA